MCSISNPTDPVAAPVSEADVFIEIFKIQDNILFPLIVDSKYQVLADPNDNHVFKDPPVGVVPDDKTAFIYHPDIPVDPLEENVDDVSELLNGEPANDTIPSGQNVKDAATKSDPLLSADPDAHLPLYADVGTLSGVVVTENVSVKLPIVTVLE